VFDGLLGGAEWLMYDDPELVLKVRELLARPVTVEESRAKRLKLIMGGLFSVVAFVFSHVYRVERGAKSWLDVILVSVVFGLPVLLDLRRLVDEYGVLRARPASPVPDDVLEHEVRRSRLCPSCRAVAPTAARECPGCRGVLRTTLSAEAIRNGVLTVALMLLFFWYQSPSRTR
jgi:hypothetical protein